MVGIKEFKPQTGRSCAPAGLITLSNSCSAGALASGRKAERALPKRSSFSHFPTKKIMTEHSSFYSVITAESAAVQRGRVMSV